MRETTLSQRLTRKQKDAHQKRWFKDQLDGLDISSFTNGGLFSLSPMGDQTSEYRRMKINYDLFNNKINKTDFEHVCSPFGKEVGELPADFTNKDILSGKIKALLGMEMKRPFSWKVVATNEEATTRREAAEFDKLKEFVVNSIVAPIRTQIEQKYAEENKGKELTPEEAQRVEQQMAEELKSMTPPEVKRYMEREHQDPAEMLSHQILEYLIKKEQIKMKFNKAWKHGLIAGREIFWVGIVNGEPTLKVVNPLSFDYDKSPELDFIEDGEWAAYEIYMTPAEIMRHFGSELTEKEIDEIYEEFNNADSPPDDAFTFRNDGMSSMMGTRVLHGEWKALKPMKFVIGIDPETGEEFEDLVDEIYEMNEDAGDMLIETRWIITKYEGYKIGSDKYAYLREVPGQYKDLSNLYECKLSYVGAAFDNLNSEVTSLVDRMKYYQYFYNILMYRVELLTASDKGKQLFMNLNLIPKSSGISVEKFMYFLETTKIGWLNPNEEGNRNTDITTAVKEIDMSLASDIAKYIELAQYVELRCGESVGITKHVEGQIGANEAVSNTRQNIVQSTHILEPYFELHNNIKQNVLQALIDCAKVAYSEFQPKYLNYILDDMSRRMINMDYDLLDNSTYGIFVSNSMKSHEALEMVQQLSHAALQNQKVELSDVIKIMRSESIPEAEELLKVAEKDRVERENAMQEQAIQAKAEAEERARQFKREEWAHEIEKIQIQEALKTDREIQKQTILSLGFNEDKDLDKDGVPDVLEVAKHGVDANIKASKQRLDEAKFQHQVENDNEKIKIEKRKLAQKSKVITK